MALSPEEAAQIIHEEDALEAIRLLADKFGLKVHVWGHTAIENLLEEAGIDAGVDTEALTEDQKNEVMEKFGQTQAWQETGLDNDIAMQDALVKILTEL